jgi:4-aminobutyrate aminotransferase-like enzyme
LANNVKPTALRLIPPLTVSEAEIDRAVEIIEQVLGRIASGTPK